MWKIILYCVFQSVLLTVAQLFFKLALNRMPCFGWNKEFWLSVFNWPMLLSGLCSLLALFVWMYIIRTFPFSQAYPIISLSYVFGMFAAIVFFSESVTLTQWLGAAMIVTGCFLIAK